MQMTVSALVSRGAGLMRARASANKVVRSATADQEHAEFQTVFVDRPPSCKKAVLQPQRYAGKEGRL